MTTGDDRTHTVCVGDVVNLLDNSQYRVFKIVTPTGPIVLKRTDHSTYRRFLRTPAHIQIRAPTMVTQSTQIEPPTSSAHDLLACYILNCCGPVAAEAYHQGRPYCLGSLHLPAPSYFVGHKLQEESIMTTRKQNIL